MGEVYGDGDVQRPGPSTRVRVRCSECKGRIVLHFDLGSSSDVGARESLRFRFTVSQGDTVDDSESSVLCTGIGFGLGGP